MTDLQIIVKALSKVADDWRYRNSERDIEYAIGKAVDLIAITISEIKKEDMNNVLSND